MYVFDKNNARQKNKLPFFHINSKEIHCRYRDLTFFKEALTGKI